MKDKEEPKKEEAVILPDNIEPVKQKAPRDLIIISQPKMGKGSILGEFTKKYNALVFDLEKGGYEFIEARKISTYTDESTTEWEAFLNYIKYRTELLKQKGKYDYLIIDGFSDLDSLSEIGGTLTYMDSAMGKKWNRELDERGVVIPGGKKYMPYDPEWKSISEMAEGFGYQHTRKWFIQQIEFFRQISPYRIYAAHVMDKFIKDNGKEEVVDSEIMLTGKLKQIIAAKVTALCKLVADDNKRFLNFTVLNDSIIAGSRAPQLEGKILISEKTDEGLKTYWETIYN